MSAFRQELKQLQSDAFKNVARVYDIFTDSACHVGFTMAYVEGKSLELNRRYTLSQRTAPYRTTKLTNIISASRNWLSKSRKASVNFTATPYFISTCVRVTVIQRVDGSVTIVDCRCLTLQLAMVAVAGPSALAAVLPFVAPEVLEGAPEDKHSDVHSFGKLIVFIMEGSADANAVHDALQGLADRAPKLAVMLRAAIDSSDQRPQFEEIFVGLQRAVKFLQERIKQRTEGPETSVEFDFLGLAREFALKYKRGELRGRVGIDNRNFRRWVGDGDVH